MHGKDIIVVTVYDDTFATIKRENISLDVNETEMQIKIKDGVEFHLSVDSYRVISLSVTGPEANGYVYNNIELDDCLPNYVIPKNSAIHIKSFLEDNNIEDAEEVMCLAIEQLIIPDTKLTIIAKSETEIIFFLRIKNFNTEAKLPIKEVEDFLVITYNF